MEAQYIRERIVHGCFSKKSSGSLFIHENLSILRSENEGGNVFRPFLKFGTLDVLQFTNYSPKFFQTFENSFIYSSVQLALHNMQTESKMRFLIIFLDLTHRVDLMMHILILLNSPLDLVITGTLPLFIRHN